MRPFGEVISLEAARAILDSTGAPIERIESIPLERAHGRVLARDVVAATDVPPFSRAGMDGYAVRAADTRGATRETPRTLKQIGTLYTGQVPSRPVHDGECMEISTGAPVPDGADAVIMVEETELDLDGGVRVYAEVRPKQNVGLRGADIQTGQVVVSAGETLNSSRRAPQRSMSTNARAWLSSPPATKLSRPDALSNLDRSTTSIDIRSLPSCRNTAEFQFLIHRRPIRSMR
jgi:molybdopterin biosynthesis enzyme